MMRPYGIVQTNDDAEHAIDEGICKMGPKQNSSFIQPFPPSVQCSDPTRHDFVRRDHGCR